MTDVMREEAAGVGQSVTDAGTPPRPLPRKVAQQLIMSVTAQTRQSATSGTGQPEAPRGRAKGS
jgi:hypothetical protein